MGIVPMLGLLASAITVLEDGTPLRTGCGPSDTVVARLKQGDPVELRFALAGEIGACYKVAVAHGSATVAGYLPAKALSGLETFEQARRQGRGFDSPSGMRKDMDAVRSLAVTASGGDVMSRAARLIESNQPVQALEMLEKQIQPGKRDPSLLALTGLAAYRGDRVQEAVRYWQESLELAPNAALQRLYQQALREAAADQSSQKLFGMRFLLRYDPREVSAEQARSLMPVLEDTFARVAEQLGCRAEERMVAVLQSREAFLRTTGAAEWSGGRYDGRIRVALLDAGASPGEQTRKTFAHETVHACLARTGNWPVWLHEGLAQKLSGETLPAHRRQELRQMARSGHLPSLDRLSGTWSRMSRRHAEIAYGAALAAVEILYQTYGPEGVRNLLQNPESLPRVTAELDRRLRD